MDFSKRWLPVMIGLPLTAVFVALGVWQLQRLAERRASNEERAARFYQPALPLPTEGGWDSLDPAEVYGRRLVLEGRWSPERELVVRGQAWMGTPGVTVLTPLVTDSPHAVLVMRGWLPAADGLAADLPAASIDQLDETVRIEGLGLEGQAPSGLPVRMAQFPDRARPALGTIDLAAADSLLDLKLAGFYAQLLPDEAAGASASSNPPRPLPPPALTDGPHALYAFQWFGFAAIALAGAFLLPKAARMPGAAPERKGEES
jgi:surfeit locus 1 family protein